MSPLVQKFRCAANGEIVYLKVNSDKSILWKHIIKSFGDVDKVRVDKMDVHFMIDEEYEDLLPLRIEAQLDSVMDVVLHGSVSEKNNDTELPPEYDNADEIHSIVLPYTNYINKPRDDYVRIGSRISFRHVNTGGFLHSVNWKYDTTQHYALQGNRSSKPGPEDFWQVVPAEDVSDEETSQISGKKIQYGTRLCLYNVGHRRWLRSRHDYKSPSSDQQEITTCESNDGPSAEDVWVVVRLEVGTVYWTSKDLFLLRHELTGHYLHSHHGCWCKEEYEITGYIKWQNDFNNLWRAGFSSE